MMKNLFVKILISLSVVAGSANSFAEVELAEFSNGEQITVEDMNEYVAKRIDLKGLVHSAFGVESVVKEMAMTRALVLEGQYLKIEAPSGRSITRFDDIYALAVYQKLAKLCVAPESKEERRSYYESNPDAFRVSATARLGRIMLPASATINGRTSNETLLGWAQEISAGSANFQKFAQEAEKYYALDPQGDLGWVTLNDEMPIMRALVASRQGDLVGPVRDGEYLYLFLVAAKHESRQLSFDEVDLEIPLRAISYCRKNEKDKITGQLYKKYNIQLNKANINGASSRGR